MHSICFTSVLPGNNTSCFNSSPKMHPNAHMSMAFVYRGAPSSSSGARYLPVDVQACSPGAWTKDSFARAEAWCQRGQRSAKATMPDADTLALSEPIRLLHTQTNRHTDTQTQGRTLTPTDTFAHTRTHAEHSHLQPHTHARTPTRTHARTHTQTDTDIRTRASPRSASWAPQGRKRCARAQSRQS
jgi:hypothetical protein